MPEIKDKQNENNNTNDKIGVMEFCDERGIREKDKLVAKMVFGENEQKTRTQWEKLLQEKEVVDFNNPIYFVNEDGKRASKEQEFKTKVQK